MGLFKDRLVGPFQRFPYTNFHDLNLDWILNVCKYTEETLQELPDAIDKSVEDALNKFNTDIADQLRDMVLGAPQAVNVMLLPDSELPTFDNTGTQDNTAAFNALLTWMRNNNRHVMLFPNGTYTLNSITLPEHFAIVGEDRYNTIIKANRYQVNPLINATTGYNCFMNLGVDMNAAQQARPINGISVTAGNVLLDNLYIKCSGDGILVLNPSASVQISNIDFADVKTSGLTLSGSGILTHNISAAGTAGYALTVTNGDRLYVSGVYAHGALQAANITSTKSYYNIMRGSVTGGTGNTIISPDTTTVAVTEIAANAVTVSANIGSNSTYIETADQYTNNGGMEIDVHGRTTAALEHTHVTTPSADLECDAASGTTVQYTGPLTVAPKTSGSTTSIDATAGDTVDIGAGREITQSVNGTHMVLSDNTLQTNAQTIKIAKAKTTLTENFDALEITTLNAAGTAEEAQQVLLKGATWPPTMGGGGEGGNNIIVETYPEFNGAGRQYINASTDIINAGSAVAALTTRLSSNTYYTSISIIIEFNNITSPSAVATYTFDDNLNFKPNQWCMGSAFSLDGTRRTGNARAEIYGTKNIRIYVDLREQVSSCFVICTGVIANANVPALPEGGTATDPNAVHITGGTMTGPLTMDSANINMQGTAKITGVVTPTTNTDAANKKYVDDAVASAGVPQDLLNRVTTLEDDNTSNMTEIAELKAGQATQDTKIAANETSAANAATTANTAKTTADAAKTAADAAKETALAAQTTADTAQTTASNASKTADEALQGASTALGGLSEANTSISRLQTRMSTAENNIVQLQNASGGEYPLFSNIVTRGESFGPTTSSGATLNITIAGATAVNAKLGLVHFKIVASDITSATVVANFDVRWGDLYFDTSKIATTFCDCQISELEFQEISTTATISTTSTEYQYAFLMHNTPISSGVKVTAYASLIIPLAE